MGEKSTVTRDKYADELQAYIDETPIAQWPVYRQKVSRSGLERVMRSRGFSSFERKRLESAACQPIIKKMNRALEPLFSEKQQSKKVEIKVGIIENNEISKELATAKRRIEQLEKSLRKAEQQNQRYSERCALLQTEIESNIRQRDAFQQHCYESLRTLHVE